MKNPLNYYAKGKNKMLGDFSYSNPTTLYFGKDSLLKLNEELPKYGPNVLLVYGGGSIKKSGLYGKVLEILKANGKTVFEDAGVMPNPTLAKVEEGCRRAREGKVDLILAVGGGSVVDYAKAVAASTYYEGDFWDKFFVKQEDPTGRILPVGCVLTMVGTGSEMNGGSVVTNTEAHLKIGKVFGPELYPKFSCLNPELTYTLPKYQMIAGIFDIMSHILEQYMSGTDDNTSDYLAEGLMKSLVHSSRIAVKNPTDYEARSNLMWIATWALNTLIAKGKTTDWEVHMIGQSVSAYTDATHGMTLACVSIPYYKFIMDAAIPKFKRFAVNVFGIDPAGRSDEEVAKAGIEALKSWMQEIGLVLNLRELGVTEEMITPIAKGSFILTGGYKVLTLGDIEKILKEAM